MSGGLSGNLGEVQFHVIHCIWQSVILCYSVFCCSRTLFRDTVRETAEQERLFDSLPGLISGPCYPVSAFPLSWLVCIYGKWSLMWRIPFLYVFRLIEHLPRANVFLLRYIFGVLHGIEMRSEENQMNAFNLAVCIAPSLLWPPVSSTPDIESEFIKKVRNTLA